MRAPGAGRAGIILVGARGVWRCTRTLSMKGLRGIEREGGGRGGCGGFEKVSGFCDCVIVGGGA